MANQDGEFILRIKYPEAVKVAFRQRAKLLARVIDAMPKKQRSPDYEKYLQTEKTRALIRWLDKLENQFPIHHEGGIFGQQSIDMKLFSRYAKKNSLITTTLSDSEYFRIVALEQNPRSRQTVIADLQTAQLEEYARWLNYLLVHEGKNEYEKWFRYLVLHEVATHDARGRKRDPDTTSGVLPFSANALSRIRDAFTGPVAVVHNAIAILEQSKRNDALRAALYTHKNESSSDTASQLERNDEKLLRKENDKIVKKGKHEATNLLVEFPFSERYKHYLALEQQAKIKVLSISEGWHTVTDIDLLTTLSAGTDWCVAGIRTAHTYLDPKGSQMRVFIKKGRPVIGVYSINGEIKESPRGTLSNQNIAPEFLSELALELDQYDNSDSWQQQVEKARTQGILIAKLTENPGATLSLDDLRCVYELDAVQSFGYQPLQSFLKIKITREETRLIEDVALLWPTLTKEEQLTFISGGRHRIAAVLYTITPEEEVALAKELITPSFRSEASKKTYYIHLLMRNIDLFTRADQMNLIRSIVQTGNAEAFLMNFSSIENFDPSEVAIAGLELFRDNKRLRIGRKDYFNRFLDGYPQFSEKVCELMLEIGYLEYAIRKSHKFPFLKGEKVVARMQAKFNPGDEGYSASDYCRALISFPTENATSLLQHLLTKKLLTLRHIVPHMNSIAHLDMDWLAKMTTEVNLENLFIDELAPTSKLDIPKFANDLIKIGCVSSARQLIKHISNRTRAFDASTMNFTPTVNALIEYYENNNATKDLFDYLFTLTFTLSFTFTNLDASIAEKLLKLSEKTPTNNAHTPAEIANKLLLNEQAFTPFTTEFKQKLETLSNNRGH